MSTFGGSAAPQGGMYVRALYDYEADDRTSLSFRQGDIIQVITQLESGWWDGFINGVRGWFPSNYCAVVPRPADDQPDFRNGADTDDDGGAGSVGDGDYPTDTESEAENEVPQLPIEGAESNEQEEAAFWIPQATPDGRLFYFNTLTGVSTMELPLETPTANESGPRDRMNVFIPDVTRPPPELMAGGYNVDTDDENGASDAEGHPAMAGSISSLPGQRHSFSNGVSPAPSMDSINGATTMARPRGETSMSSFSAVQSTLPPNGIGLTSFISNSLGSPVSAAVPRRFFDDSHAVPLTWNRMVDDMRRAVERYRQAINNSDRSEFVKRAEDISDHLRLLLTAGSGTTDNHSGNPSIISTNKALYPHFRETMSRFSKLVLSSHIAAADWPPPDSYSKCLKEAEGVLQGVYGFVEVARQQRGEDIPRLIPGFVVGSMSGGSWHSNGINGKESIASMSFIDQEDSEPSSEPSARLEAGTIARLEAQKKLIATSVRRLDEHMVLRERIVTPARHRAVGDNICAAAAKVLDLYRPWLSLLESIDLSPLTSTPQGQQLGEFSVLKQQTYDLVADLVMNCQAVASPLADEWSDTKGDTLEDRIKVIQGTSRGLEVSTTQLFSLLQQLAESAPNGERNGDVVANGPEDADQSGQRERSHSQSRRPTLPTPSKSYAGSTNAEAIKSSTATNQRKVMDFFGEMPAPIMHQPVQEEVPDFLKLDHEGELSYDHKADPPQLRGGTLTGLVEQLTRHDRLDAPFNNTFLLTYQSFTTAQELFEMLVKRWSIQPPYGLAKEDYQTWVDKKQKPIRFRVVNILKSWFDNFWMEGNDEDAQILIQKVYNFARDHVATTSTPGAGPLMTSVEQRSRGQDMPAKRLVLTMNAQTPQPILPKHMKRLKFLDIDTMEFARQLTIIESRLYGKIKPTECLNKTWQKKLNPGDPDPAANVKALILHSNQLTNWVAQIILTQQDVRKRVAVIKHFVSVADKCRSLNNFSTLTSIISALGTAPIHRLSRTWAAVNARTMTTLESMRKLMSSNKNFFEYRETLHKANPPCIPFFGVYLTDLTFIEDGISSLIKKTELINFAKRAKTADVIHGIQQYQNVPYPLQPVPELQDYILSNMQNAGDVHEMYDMSLQVEPREREDEKIARLLSESGFL